jgi:hypothetical protein
MEKPYVLLMYVRKKRSIKVSFNAGLHNTRPNLARKIQNFVL